MFFVQSLKLRGDRSVTRSRSTTRPFQHEREEGAMLPARRKRLFGPEPEERQVLPKPDPRPHNEDFSTNQTTTFSFGWQQLQAAARARLATKVSERPSRKKRPYDNSHRAAQADNKRLLSKGKFARNGLSRDRVRSLFSQETCSCHLPVIQHGKHDA